MPQTTDAFFSTEITNHLFQKNQRRENFGLGIGKPHKSSFLSGSATKRGKGVKAWPLKKHNIF